MGLREENSRTLGVHSGCKRLETFATDEELWLFVDWLLSDVAERAPSGKNPSLAIKSFAINYPQRDPRKRGKSGIRVGGLKILEGLVHGSVDI
jgi:hypothetical protein